MNTKKVISVVSVLISIMLFGGVYLWVTTGNATSQGNSKTLRLIFNMDPAQVIHKEGQAIPVYQYDPRDDVTESLKAAGFTIVSEESPTYDFTVTVIHRERAQQMLGEPAPRIIIESIGFVLQDQDETVLLKDMRGPYGVYDNMEAVKEAFAKDVAQFTMDKLQAGEMEDEVVFWTAKIKEEGFNEDLLQRISELKDPRAADAIVPLLRICYAPDRWDVKFTLWDLGYEPESLEEKAMYAIVNLVEPFKGTVEYMNRAEKLYDNTSGSQIITAYGTTAIDLFLNDLACSPQKGWYEGEATPRNAKWALSGIKDPELISYTATRLIAALQDEQLEIEDKDRYLSDVIEILKELGDQRAIEALQSYLTHPELGEEAQEAIATLEQTSPKQPASTTSAETQKAREIFEQQVAEEQLQHTEDFSVTIPITSEMGDVTQLVGTWHDEADYSHACFTIERAESVLTLRFWDSEDPTLAIRCNGPCIRCHAPSRSGGRVRRARAGAGRRRATGAGVGLGVGRGRMNTTAMRIEVVVEWTKEAELQGYTWPAWILIGIYGDLVRLEARHDHDALHEGGCIWAHSRLIRGMSETS